MATKPTERTKSTSKKRRKKAVPTTGRVLTPNSNGQWMKKINGKQYCFGKDYEDAVRRYHYELPSIMVGKRVYHSPDGQPEAPSSSVATVCNLYLEHRQKHVERGDLTKYTWQYCRRLARHIIACFGRDRDVATLEPDDFLRLRQSYSETMPSPYSLDKAVKQTKTMLRHAEPDGANLIPGTVRFGKGFSPPPKRAFRLRRAQQPKKFFSAEQIHKLLDEAALSEGSAEPLRAAILLGINCGYSPIDCRLLRPDHLDPAGFATQPRHKTGIERRNPLWPETTLAITTARETAPKPATEQAAEVIFRTRRGNPWKRTSTTHAFKRLLEKTGLYLPGRTFSALRHTLQTVAENEGGGTDRAAIAILMGHADRSMAGVYCEHVADERLLRLTDSVRAWFLRG